MGSKADAKIVLYTNHGCPWAHRAHIALAELGIPFDEEIIDLSVPRTPEYLKVNPRGLVPSVSYNGTILTESAVVANFLADAYPSHLQPDSGTPEGALKRAQIAFFVDTFFTKFNSLFFNRTFWSKADAEKDEIATQAVQGLVKEVEPLLADANPFFGGSEKLTQAEVLTGSFALRLVVLLKHDVLPRPLAAIPEQAPNFWKWAQKVAIHPSVTNIFDEEKHVNLTKQRLAALKAAST